MKRYNIHLDPEWMKALDEIRRKLTDVVRHNYDFWGLSRSGLIRFAIGQVFDLKEKYPRFNEEYLKKIIKEMIKKRANRKGV